MKLWMILFLSLCLPLCAQSVQNASIVDDGGKNIMWLSNDRTTLFGYHFNGIWRSTDNAATWNLLHSFTTNGSANIYGIRQLANGELLVSQANGGGNPGLLFLSSGYPTLGASATWASVLTTSSTSNYISGQWGMSSYENIVVVSEYGSKVCNINARYVYLSQDYGVTWHIIFDIGTDCVSSQLHVHGSAYDPYCACVWVTNGDSTNHSTRVSFDPLDTTPVWNQFTFQKQFVTIVPMPQAILFLSDDGPSGVYSLARSSPQVLTDPSLAYQLDAGAQAEVGSQPYWAGAPYPALLAFSTGNTGKGTLVATFNGISFVTLWQDTITYNNGMGLQAMVGPTTTGSFLAGALYDGRQTDQSILSMNQVLSSIANGASVSEGASIQ
jgi:hypothetical protein